MNKINVQFHKTKYGEFILGSFDNRLCLLDFRYRKMRTTVDNRIKKGLNAEYIESDNDLLKKTRRQLQEYFCWQRKEFSIPILTIGTDFQKSVWKALAEVPYGKTSTYLDLAKKINGVVKGKRELKVKDIFLILLLSLGAFGIGHVLSLSSSHGIWLRI